MTTNSTPRDTTTTKPLVCAYCAFHGIDDEQAVRWTEGDPKVIDAMKVLVRRLHGLYVPACHDCAESAIEDGAKVCAMSASERQGFLQ